MNRDRYGIIGQIQNDGSVEGGDAVTFNGHWLYLNNGVDPDGSTVKNVEDFVNFFEVSFGGYVRHPKKEMTFNGFGAHYKNPWNGCISRDQLTGILCALVAGRHWKAMLRVMGHSALSGFLLTYNNIINGRDPEKMEYNLKKYFYNPRNENVYKFPDPMGPDMWATMLRGFGKFSWIFWPVLNILDIHTLLNTIHHRYDDNDDVISFAGKYMVSRSHVPTITSWLTSKILNRKKLLADLKEYWCGWRDNCDFYDRYEQKI